MSFQVTSSGDQMWTTALNHVDRHHCFADIIITYCISARSPPCTVILIFSDLCKCPTNRWLCRVWSHLISLLLQGIGCVVMCLKVCVCKSEVLPLVITFFKQSLQTSKILPNSCFCITLGHQMLRHPPL